jgi:hypothetical protein
MVIKAEEEEIIIKA